MPAEVRRLAEVRGRLREAGQLIPMFALSIFVLMGMMAIVIDVSWYWTNTLRVQRAADAAALAGAVWLPGNVQTAYLTAQGEATKNGYTTGGGTTVTPIQDSLAPGGTDPRQLDVTITAQVNTFFMRIFGLPSITASRSSKAEFVQPVPMGSPLNYYGISCLIPLHPSATWPTPACAAAGNSNGPSGVDAANTTTEFASQGFWGVVFQRGGDARNGDAFSPLQVSNGGSWVSNSNPPNAQGNFQPSGYTYTVEIPNGNGRVFLFDPQFCEVGEGGNGQSGVGDQYTTAAPGASSPGIVTTYYNLFNTQGTDFTVGDDTLVNQLVYSDVIKTDQTKNTAGEFVWGTPAARAGAVDCGSEPAHNKWVRIANGLPTGKYRLQVTTTNVDTTIPSGGTIPLPSQPSELTGAANRFGIEVKGALDANGKGPRVYGNGLMGAYNNLPAGTQLFYLAQIDKRNAGKTAVISLYDPGDVNGGAWLRILSPDGNKYAPATFSFSSIDKGSGVAGTSGTNVTCVQTNEQDHSNMPPTGCPNSKSGGSKFDGKWLTINVAIPQGYGTTVPASGGTVGLTPSSESDAGWWKIEYTVNGGNDTTTWQVNIRGNPVHLVVQ